MCPEEKFHRLVNLLEFPYPRKHFLVFIVAQVVVVTTSMPWIERVKSTTQLPFNTQYIEYSRFSILMPFYFIFYLIMCSASSGKVHLLCCSTKYRYSENKHHLEIDEVLLRNDALQIDHKNFQSSTVQFKVLNVTYHHDPMT